MSELNFLYPTTNPYDTTKTFVYATGVSTDEQKKVAQTQIIRAKENAIFRNEGANKRRKLLINTHLI